VVRNAIAANPQLKDKLSTHDDYEEDEKDEDTNEVSSEPKEYFLEDSDYRIREFITPELKEVLDKAFALSQILTDCESSLESAFGDGFRVKLTKTGITTEEYSHD